MKKLTAVLSALCAFFAISTAHAEHTRVTHPSALSVELLGRGLVYSIAFDRVLNDELAAGIGFGTAGLSGSGSATMIPAYANYYFQREQGSLYATAGVTLAAGDAVETSKTNFGEVELNNIVPTVGLGYENRSDAGFLFRITGYGLIGRKFQPWGGFAFGYSF